MAALLYIHGFLSSPASFKAVQVRDWLAQHRPDIAFICPQLTPYPQQTRQQLSGLVEQQSGPLYLMGSSLGGFWASWLAEEFDLPAVLINPSVNPQLLLPPLLQQPLRNYHSDERYTLNAEHLQQMCALANFQPRRVNNYWVLLQTGDETLDYRLAVAHYARSQCLVEDGGDHSFQGFERFIAPAVTFFEDFYGEK